jgi:hypothetical protein
VRKVAGRFVQVATVLLDALSAEVIHPIRRDMRRQLFPNRIMEGLPVIQGQGRESPFTL